LARLLRSYAGAALEDQALWHERDISHSSVERVILPDATTLANYMLVRMNDLVANSLLFPEKMEHNMHMTRGLIYSQRVLLTLIDKGLSRQDAYTAVQNASKQVWEEGVEFDAALLSIPGVRNLVSAAELREMLDYRHYLVHVPAIFARAGVPLPQAQPNPAPFRPPSR
jgi:adenylosuccinate lyase